MFDYRKIMNERTLLEPIPTPVPKDFPHTDEVPEGCHVINDLQDEWGYYVDIHTDVVYAERSGRFPYTFQDTTELKMIILEPRVHFGASDEEMAKPRKWPCVAYIQGSAFHEQWMWNNISRHIRLAEQGYVVAIIEYRPSEVSPFPAQMQDAKTAIRFLRKNADKYHIDAERMAVAGDSSGGHTALMAGFTGDTQPDTDLYAEYSAEVKCIVDVYGPTVFALMNYYDSSQNHYLPDSPEGYEIGQKNVLENLELAEQTIPMNYLSKERSTPPTLIIHGSRDMLVPFNQSCQLYTYMKELGKDVEFYKLNGANHGCLGFDNDTVMGIVLDFLKQHL